MSLFDEQALRALLEQAVERAVRKVLREDSVAAGGGDRWIPTAPLSKQFSVSQSTIRHWIRKGKLRSVRVGRALRVNRGDFERLLSMPHGTDGNDPSPEELADRDEVRERRPKKL